MCEVIGYNILQFTCGQKYDISQRAKFSTLTDEEITKAFENLLPPNHSLKDAEVTRYASVLQLKRFAKRRKEKNKNERLRSALTKMQNSLIFLII
jgi:DNA topoisomerase IA